MEMLVGLSVGCVIFSGGAGFALGKTWASARERRALAGRMVGEDQTQVLPAWMLWRLRHGVAITRPISQAMLGKPYVRQYAQWGREYLEERSLVSSEESLVSLLLATGVILVVGGYVAGGSLVFGVALVGALLVSLCSALKAARERRTRQLREEVPEALRSMGVCFRAGLSLAQTMRQTATEMKGPLKGLFYSSALMLETGGTTREALAGFRQRSDAPELSFVAVALDVQHKSGGSLMPVLDAARESVEGEIELSRSLQVQTAQAKLSARIVTAMPFVLIALFSLMSPGFLSPFFESFGGFLLLLVALVMQVAGVLLVRRMLNLEDR